jgi:heterodisulfide reductase subunit C
MSNEKDKPASETKTIQLSENIESRKGFIKEVMKMLGGERILECIQCGSCAGGCPAMFAMDYSPMQIIKMINLGMKEKVLSSSTIWVCSACYTCTVRCPRNVDFTSLMMSLKYIAIRENMVKDSAKSDFHKYFFEVINKYGRNHEPELLIKLLDSSNLASSVRLGLRLLKKGKMPMRAPRTEHASYIKSMLEKTDQEEQQ